MPRQLLLSKSRFLDGLQCSKKVYLGLHSPKLASPPGIAQQAIFDQGTRLGELARCRWPDGILVAAPYFKHDQAVDDTNRLLADPSVNVIFEAGFSEVGARIRADVLVRVEGESTWDMIEVKGSTTAKPIHDADIGIQSIIIEAAGIKLRKKMLLTVDNGYVYDGVQVDTQKLFKLHDRTEQVTAAAPGTRSTLRRMQEVVAGPVPKIEPASHCHVPYDCPFWDHCTENAPEDWILQLPRINSKSVVNLRSQGIEDIKDIPSTFPLTDQQSRIRASVISGEEWISPGLTGALPDQSLTNYFLDFETFNPAIPLYAGTRPYERIPFQWSCHAETSEGVIEHAEFLAPPAGDPRRAFAESLVDHLGDAGPIVVYSPFEKGVINALEGRFPDLADKLRSIKVRLWDLLDVTRKNYYHPGFHGSYSIKAVLPALVPGLAYGDLALQAGDSASASYQSMVTSDQLGEDDRLRIESELKEYCAMDTLAMVKILGRLRSTATR